MAIRTATQNKANQNDMLIISSESEEENDRTAQNLITVKYKKTKEPERSNEDIVDEFLMMQETNKEIEEWSRLVITHLENSLLLHRDELYHYS